MIIALELDKIAKTLKDSKPYEKETPTGFPHRLEAWETVALAFSEYLPDFISTESFLELCGFYE